MANTANLRRQHEELLATVDAIEASLDPEKLGRDAKEVRKLLSVLSGKLKVHLAMEDKCLYPQLLSHENEIIRDTAKRFIIDIGELGRVLEAYLQEWPSHVAVQEKPETFIVDTRAILMKLSKRIAKEDRVLFVLLDQ